MCTMDQRLPHGPQIGVFPALYFLLLHFLYLGPDNVLLELQAVGATCDPHGRYLPSPGAWILSWMKLAPTLTLVLPWVHPPQSSQ